MKSVLIIDDEQDIREVIQAALEDLAGWRVSLADSGSQGILQAKTEPPDAILLDVSMPEMDGFDCFHQLQADPITRAIPVVLLTARILPSDRRQFAEIGVAGIIPKPFNPITIWNQVAQILKWQLE
jgi:CheY-like chemotaxis protein